MKYILPGIALLIGCLDVAPALAATAGAPDGARIEALTGARGKLDERSRFRSRAPTSRSASRACA
jgi:hypothetical protein